MPEDETPDESTPLPVRVRGTRRRKRRLRRNILISLLVLTAVLSVSWYLYVLLSGSRDAPRKWKDDLGVLHEQRPLIRGLPTDDEDAVRRKLISKNAPSPTLASIARHKAAEMSKPLGPAYEDTAQNLELSSEELAYDDPEVRLAEQALAAYRAAISWQDRLPLIYNANHCEPRMAAFYDKQTSTDADPAEMKRATRITAGESSLIVLAYACPARGDAGLHAYFHRAPSGQLLLDWEAWAGYCEMTLPELKKSRSLVPILMRLVATESSYYNYEFADPARFLAVKLQSADGLHSITGYLLRQSLLGTAAANLIGVPLPNKIPGGTPMPPLRRPGTKALVTIRLAFPPSAQSDHCVMITELVADRWMLFPGEAK